VRTGLFWSNVILAAAHGQLGEAAAARTALAELRAQKPDFAETARETLGKCLDAEFVEHLVEGLRKAGLDMQQRAVLECLVSDPR
jgi:hypothetical protein